MSRALLLYAPAAMLVGLFGLAVGLTRSTAHIPPAFPPVTEMGERNTIYFQVASEESRMRAEGAKEFPADTWSQDDAYHNLEFKKAKKMAADRKRNLGDILQAIDDGMHERWPSPYPMNPKIIPCKPRPIH